MNLRQSVSLMGKYRDTIPIVPLCISSVSMVSLYFLCISRVFPGSFSEPPGADPHAGWCGEGERKAHPYPIGISNSVAFEKWKMGDPSSLSLSGGRKVTIGRLRNHAEKPVMMPLRRVSRQPEANHDQFPRRDDAD